MMLGAEGNQVELVVLLGGCLGATLDVGVLYRYRPTPADVPIGVASVKADGRFA